MLTKTDSEQNLVNLKFDNLGWENCLINTVFFDWNVSEIIRFSHFSQGKIEN